MFRSGNISLACVVFALLAAGLAGAQCPTPGPDSPFVPKLPAEKRAAAEPVLPEAGLLSNTHYTSQFFGFSFELPLTVDGHRVIMPLMPEKRHALLALQFEHGQQSGYILVTAEDPRPGFDVNIPEARQRELDSLASTPGAMAGVVPVPVPQFMLRNGHFHHRFSRRGRNYAAEYWTGINNYLVKILVFTNDEPFLRKAKDAMSDARFYCPQDDGTLLDSQGKPVMVMGEPYAGPTVPTFRVDAALHDEPGKQIPAGEFSDGIYRNPELGFQYTLPAGWKPVVSEPLDPPTEATALREYRFLHACSATLLQAIPPEQKVSEANKGAAVVLRALDPNCLALRIANSLTDKRGADEVAASFEELREFGQIGSDELISIAGHLFMVFHGTISTVPRGAELGARHSQIMFATRYNKLLLVWTFLAPDVSALDALPTGELTFEGSPAIQMHAAKALGTDSAAH